MFSKFKLDNLNEAIFPLYYEVGKKIYDDSEERILCSLNDVTDEDGSINGTCVLKFRGKSSAKPGQTSSMRFLSLAFSRLETSVGERM